MYSLGMNTEIIAESQTPQISGSDYCLGFREQHKFCRLRPSFLLTVLGLQRLHESTRNLVQNTTSSDNKLLYVMKINS